MTIKGVQAWVTSAVEDQAAAKSLVLAASLRRVRTAKKLAVLTTSAVSRNLREKLEEVFDLVLLLEQTTLNGLKLEEYAKIQAFSLLVFSKCVYLAPQTLVLKNCDEIFDNYGCFAICGGENDIDTSVYMFTPSIRLRRALEKIVHVMDSVGDRVGGDFSKYFKLWMKNHVPNPEELGREFNVRLGLNTTTEECVDAGVAIANFFDAYPLDYAKDDLEMGAVAKFAVDEFWMMYNEQHSAKKTIDFELSSSSFSYETEPIAIIGIDFRFPGANNPSEFWNLLSHGKEGIIQLPPHRWTKQHICLPCKNRKVEAGFLNFPIDEFDFKFFGVSPKDTPYLDPQQRLLHEVTWHSLEDAGIDPLSLSATKTGIFVGSWVHDYKDILVRSADFDFLRMYMGNSIAATSARLSHFLGTTGPSIATESGCSSGIVAIDMGVKSLKNHDSDLALACGVNLLLHPFDPKSLGLVFSPSARCKTFDLNADGFGRAEGCAVLVMKRLSDAVRDGNKVWGLIRGSAVTQEGLSKSLGTPTVHSESLAMKLALEDAGVEPKDVTFVETHGTGTQVGDPMETAAIAKAYSKGRTSPLVIGSVKTNIGHTESVSGHAGIIKVLLSLKHETLPAHLNFETLNPNINLDIIPAKIPHENLPWRRELGKPRLAGVSSFGISGGDGHVIIEEAPQLPKTLVDFQLERPLHIMKISAKSEESFQVLLETYERLFLEKAEKSQDEDFGDVAYSANTGRSTFNHRAVLVAPDFSQAASILKSKSFKQAEISSGGASPICFLFTGQGSQYPNMASELYKTCPVFKAHFDKCTELLQTSTYNIPIKKILWEGPGDDKLLLDRTLFSQTSIFCVEYCLLKLWESWGVKPDFVLGHSLGEFAAAVATGSLGLEDALMLVAERSRLIDSLPQGKMLVLKSDKKSVDHLILKYKETHLEFWADYAALNSPDQTVIAGEPGMIEEFAKFCEETKGLKTILLKSSHAFHSRQMEPILDEYRRICSTVQIKQVSSEHAPKYISGMDGTFIEASQLDADYWVRHTREKVSFMEACKAVHSEGCTLFLELGPHPVLSALTMMNIEGGAGVSVKCLPSLRRQEREWTTLLDSLSKLYLSDWKGEINWKGFDRFYPRKKVDLPFYPFNRKPAWVKFIHQTHELHPLLGRVLMNASNQTIFERAMTVKNTNFVQDHVIGNTILFPGAGFLELALSAGYASVQGLAEEWIVPRRPIGICNLKIAAPLALYDSEAVVLQTVVTLNDNKEEAELGYSVSIHRNKDTQNSMGGDEWVLHATATFQPVAKINPFPEVNIKEIQDSWEKCEILSEFYEKLPEVGLRFGPKFQSLQRGWRSETGILAQVKVPQEDEPDLYLIHPVVGDAMLQAVMFWMSKDKDSTSKRKLQVPLRIGEFTWLTSFKSGSADRYIYCSTNAPGPYSLLLDDEGTPLALMTDIDFAETNTKLIEGMIRQQTSAMPALWEEIWKSSPGPLENRINLDNVQYPIKPTDSAEERLRRLNDVGETERNVCRNLLEMTHSFLLEALYKLGWKPDSGTEFSLDDLLKSLRIKTEHKMYIRFYLRSISLKRGGFLQMLDEDGSSYRVKTTPPTMGELVSHRKSLEASVDTGRIDFTLISDVGQVLHEMFTGEVDPLSILFTEDPSKANKANDIYHFLSDQISEPMILTMDSFVWNTLYETLDGVDTQINSRGSPTVRILEVGSGTGIVTRSYLQIFEERNARYEFWYTDISAAFFKVAEQELGELTKHVIFKKFDMEVDPFEQGLCPGYFDTIMACHVLHISKDIEKTLKNLRPLLKPCGTIQIMETVGDDPRVTFIWGLLEGYWRFEDYHIRPFHVSIPTEKWVEVLHSAKFPRVEWRPAYDGIHACIIGFGTNQVETTLKDLGGPKHAWLIFDDGTELTQQLREKLVGINRKVVVFSKPDENEEGVIKDRLKSIFKQISESCLRLEGILYLWSLTDLEDTDRDRDQRHISMPLLTLLQLMQIYDKSADSKLYAATHGVYPICESEVLNPSSGTIRGVLGSISNENVHLKGMQLDLCPRRSRLAQVEEIFQNFWFDDNPCLAYREGRRFVPKLASLRLANEYLPLPNGCSRFQLQLPESKLIPDLEFIFLEPFELKEEEIEVDVKAYALNFRDLFAVLKPTTTVFDDFNSLGLDYAGIVTRVGEKVTKWKVGDRIIAMDVENKYSLASHEKLGETLAIGMPERMTFAEGCTLPAVFLTTFYSFKNVAKLKRGETVLIHTGSGGVGLSAIQVAKWMGANIITTAGSPRKRNYLRNLGIKHIFHSRTTQFSKQILEVTKGRGVDVVLNSLTGPGFKEASLECLAKGGRFVEMSKLNVWKGEEVEKLRPDVVYKIVDFLQLKEAEWRELREELIGQLDKNFVKPIPYDRFDALNIRAALSYLQKAKHIGKIVCIMPEVKLEQSKLVASTPLFNEDSTYLVTGGLGGIGFELVKWMLTKGAKHIAIAGRSPPSTDTRNMMDSWNKSGKHVQAFSVDVGNYEECKQLINDLKSSGSFPPLRGVMHAAGVLRDATIENQSWDSFRHCYNPKINGSWNLHDLTKDLMLEHFVLFSSAASTFGSPGQANHASGNSFKDTLAHYRKSIGLPATTVNWANWGEVGVATEIDFPGIRPISTSQGFLALETFLRTQRTQTVVANIDSFALMATLFPQLKTYVDDKRLFGETKINVTMNTDEFWAEVDSAEDREEKVEVFKNFIKITVRTTLKMDASEEIDDNAEFQSIGIDSLMMLEMKNGMQNVLGARMTLTAGQLKDCTTTFLLGNKLVDILEGEEDEKNVPNQEDLKILIREDSQLPEHICPGKTGASGVVSSDSIRRVLLTGVTGNMGPYFLRDLSRRENIDKIYCLIRKSGKESPASRLHSRLKKTQLLEEVTMEKVECLQGDITNQLFGLGEELYGELSEDVDVIFHCAVRSDHTAKYWKAPPSRKGHVRTANVGGTRNVLEFAVTKKLKHIFYGSTLLTVATTDGNSHLSEEWQDVGAFDDVSVNTGYPLSKHICEQLIKQAIDRGIPCKVFRLPFVGGDSRTGRVDFESSHLMLRCLGMMKLGCVPDIPLPVPLVPVDKCVSISLSTFFDKRAGSDVYHVCNRNPEVEQVLVGIAEEEFGIQVETVSYIDFVKRLKAIDDNSPLAPFTKSYQEVEVMENAESPGAKCFQKYLENSQDYFTNAKLEGLYPDFEENLEPSSVVLRRDLHFLEKSGVFKKFGIETTN